MNLKKVDSVVTVGMPVTRHPPYRSVRAVLPHTAPTSSVWRQSGHWGMDVRAVEMVSYAFADGRTFTMSIDLYLFGCVFVSLSATFGLLQCRTCSQLAYFPVLHGIVYTRALHWKPILQCPSKVRASAFSVPLSLLSVSGNDAYSWFCERCDTCPFGSFHKYA